jgi:hypothetical protein
MNSYTEIEVTDASGCIKAFIMLDSEQKNDRMFEIDEDGVLTCKNMQHFKVVPPYKTTNMIRQLKQDELLLLILLAGKAGEGDLLDFIHWVQITHDRTGMSTNAILNMVEWMPAPEGNYHA